ncbi:nuclear transport factor 2 family protein [Streptomyces sp. NBC_01275]|uniref:nuclear transport factor 2 family protein n=1 Tax=Streptomyces sp. NBC_01275 TaxID=2903807 RepID=UPI00225644B1|nr:nuclear transport factor 2 family protein [Streptomyces sp. NBC_01275]MCX4763644.1 nuclear transport factor 2 family protein [Streptomyces sp. NBC_01275]
MPQPRNQSPSQSPSQPRSQPRAIAPDALPEVITRCLKAHRAHDTAAAVASFADDATVVDDGHTYQGIAAIEGWLDRAASEFTYTVELIDAQQTDATRFVAVQHLEGDFPGGAVDLRYQFTLHGDLVESLVIEP